MTSAVGRWRAVAFLLTGLPALGASVETLVGTGVPGFTDLQVNNPYGMIIGPDGAMYFCDVDNQRVRRLDLRTKRMTTIAGNGEKGYTGDGGPAVNASIAAPHELAFDAKGDLFIAERDNHVIRKVDRKTGTISTVAGTGVAGFGGDGGPGAKAQLRQPHCIVSDGGAALLICDIGNNRIRRLKLDTGTIETYAGTGEKAATVDGTGIRLAALNEPRTLVVGANGDFYLALREGNAVYRIDGRTQTMHLLAGTGEHGYTGDGGAALRAKLGGPGRLDGPKGLAYAEGALYIADTENHAIRRVDLKTGIIATVLGTGEKGDGPESDPLRCKLNRPHGVLAAHGVLYVSDSENHRIRVETLGN